MDQGFHDFCLPVKAIYILCYDQSLSKEDVRQGCEKFGKVRGIKYLGGPRGPKGPRQPRGQYEHHGQYAHREQHCHREQHGQYAHRDQQSFIVFFLHVWDAQRAVIELDGKRIMDTDVTVFIPEPTCSLWVGMTNVTKSKIIQRFEQYGNIEKVHMLRYNAIVHFEDVESAILALVYEQDTYYDNGHGTRLLHVNFHDGSYPSHEQSSFQGNNSTASGVCEALNTLNAPNAPNAPDAPIVSEIRRSSGAYDASMSPIHSNHVDDYSGDEDPMDEPVDDHILAEEAKRYGTLDDYLDSSDFQISRKEKHSTCNMKCVIL